MLLQLLPTEDRLSSHELPHKSYATVHLTIPVQQESFNLLLSWHRNLTTLITKPNYPPPLPLLLHVSSHTSYTALFIPSHLAPTTLKKTYRILNTLTALAT